MLLYGYILDSAYFLAHRFIVLGSYINISIFKPGVLKNRRNPRCMERFIGCWCCCIANIDAIDCANSLKAAAERNSKRKSE